MRGPNRAKNFSDMPADSALLAVYPHLRRIARRLLRSERVAHTLQPTALANEAVARLLKSEAERVDERELIAFGIQEMRRILIDSGRRYRTRLRHQRSWQPNASDEKIADLSLFHHLLDRLGARDPRAKRVCELRYFVGLSIPEVAAELGVSPRTVNGDWEYARAWLSKHWGDNR